MKGMIFDVQRSSFVDGDGVRTAVFFKGCNLRCRWCHNPEGIDPHGQILFYPEKCTGCGECHDVCQGKEGECTLCGKCATYCPSGAREACGREYGAQELYEIIARDKALYEETGGGVTFSGGECTLQIDFLEEMLRLCHQNGINTSVDTAGNVPFEYFQRILPYTNTFLYDVKCIDEKKHREGTGCSNRLILENLNKLLSHGAMVEVRVPVIGGFNDSEGDMQDIAKLLKGKGVHKVELLPYHKMGEHKYEGLGRSACEYQVPTKEQINKFKEIFKEINL